MVFIKKISSGDTAGQYFVSCCTALTVTLVRFLVPIWYCFACIVALNSALLCVTTAFAGSVIIKPGPLDHFTLKTPKDILVNKDFKVIIEANDAWDNQVINYYETGKSLDVTTNGRGQISPLEVLPWSFEDGRAIVYFQYSKPEPFAITVREKEGNTLGCSPIIHAYESDLKIPPDKTQEETLDSGEPDHFLVISPREIIAGEPFNIVVEARDRNNKLISDYNLKGSDVEIVSSPSGTDQPVVIEASLFNNGRAVVNLNNTRSGMVTIMARTKQDTLAENSYYSQILPAQTSVRSYSRQERIAQTLAKLDEALKQKTSPADASTPGEETSSVQISDDSVKLFINLFPESEAAEQSTEKTAEPTTEKTTETSIETVTTNNIPEKTNTAIPDENKVPDENKDSEELLRMAKKLMGQGNYPEAERLLEEALRLDPDNKDIKIILQRLGQIIKINE